jgi:hypothetical protein
VAHVTAEAKLGREAVGNPIPGVCVRVARKGLTRHGVRKSGKQRSYREAFSRFGATDEIPKGYATPGVLRKECGSC